MNQNVFGVILFTVIVGTAIFISRLFAPMPEPPRAFAQPAVTEVRTSCHKKGKKSDVKIIQAVLNPRTKKLDIQLKWGKDLAGKGSPVNFHFFEQTPNGFRHITSENLFLNPEFEGNDSSISNVTSSYSWLDSRFSYHNLYVIVEPSREFNPKIPSKVAFNAEKAAPILLDKGN